MKSVLVLLIGLLCTSLSFVCSYQGGGAVFLALGTFYRPAFLAIILITLVWLIAAIFWNWGKATGVTILLATLLIVSLLILASLRLIDLFPGFLSSIIGNTILQLSICIITFLIIRFIIAAIEVAFDKVSFVRLTTTLAMLIVSIVSSLSAYSDSRQRLDDVVQQTIKAGQIISFPELRILTVCGGVCLTFSLVIVAWITNQHRQVPWRYPDLIRDLALAVGSWRGTSFHNLDLSNVNFSGAKLANTDLRARKLHRTCFQGVVGLERARVDNQYLDLEYPKVQRLLTHGSSRDRNFRGFNLQGAYLQNADLRGFDFTDTNLTGADLKGADLRESVLVRTQLAGVDFQEVDLRKNTLIDANLTEANFHGADLRGCILVRAQAARTDFTEADLTGVCIEDWSVSSKTRFTDVRCDYIYRKYQDEQPSDRYPVDRDFEPGEFASLFAEPEDVVELVFKGEFNIAALSLALYKLQTDAPELNLELKGIEQREKLWVAKIRSTSSILSEQLIEERLTSVYDNPSTGNITMETTIKNSIYQDYEAIKHRLAESEQLNRQLAEVTGSQAEALKELSKRSFGNNFFISGSTITNLAGSGQIDYREAASSIRSLVTNRVDPHATLQRLIGQLNDQNVATTGATQRELIQQVLLSEANQDPAFRQFLLQQGQQIISSLPSEDIAIAVQAAIEQLRI